MKIFTGKVISKNMKDTATIAVERVIKHPVYGKRVRRIKKYHVHDPEGVKLGMFVNFMASKPYSKTKKWVIVSEKIKSIKNKKEK